MSAGDYELSLFTTTHAKTLHKHRFQVVQQHPLRYQDKDCLPLKQPCISDPRETCPTISNKDQARAWAIALPMEVTEPLRAVMPKATSQITSVSELGMEAQECPVPLGHSIDCHRQETGANTGASL